MPKGKGSEGAGTPSQPARAERHKTEGRKSETDELKDAIKYLQADFENYKKGIDREKEEFRKSANESIVRELLVIIDDLERAMDKNKNTDVKKGIELILKNLLSVLQKNGLKRIEAKGERFDPYYHEAVVCEKSDMEDGTVTEELEKGYMFNSNVIRHSKVKVAKND